MDEYLNRKNLAQRTRTSERYWEKLAAASNGPAFIRLGRAVRYKWSDVVQWLDAQGQPDKHALHDRPTLASKSAAALLAAVKAHGSDPQGITVDAADVFNVLNELERLTAAADAMVAALEYLLPKGVNLNSPNIRDRQTLPCDVEVGGLRRAQAALTAYQQVRGE